MNHYQIIRRPILTEKSNYLADELNRYTFQVDRRATKQMVRQAVEALFDVTVERVNMINMPGKTRRVGRHVVHTQEWKKAIVTLASGDSISFFEGV
ncbi:MAG: 50S ribosomal protein L23 [Chloroflexi bacterium]|nr:50S ribosomal protein L23 [Chloroflexota bacterium]